MKKGLNIFLVLALSVFCQNIFAKDWTVDAVVAKDGSGDFTTVTAAINANPNDGSDYVIFIENGIYDEKIFITKNNITLLGEDRDETIITQAILRRVFRETEDSDWGVATINIADGVEGLTLANLTIRNNFADVYPDFPDNNDHTMTIRGGGDKVIIVNCNITATGGDTLSLWNTDGGRFYHSGCFFEGYVDYVCPRGYCYISNSDFYGYNGNASIWHDGSGGKDHKFVVRNSYFDGVENFALGRFHRMAAFYLLECDFTANMRDSGGILYVGDSSANDRDKLVYGVRTYYDDCMRESGNYNWHSNNLSTAEGSPSSEQITDTWTFNNTWNPELEIHGLLECAFLPQPGYKSKGVSDTPTLSWLPGKNATKHLVYFGDSEEPDLVSETTDTFHVISTPLESASIYYWKVDEVTSEGDTVSGALWSFYTDQTKVPEQAYDPYPPIDTNMKRFTFPLSWKARTLEVDTFLLYFGTEVDPPLETKQTGVTYYVTGLVSDTTYYWRVDCQNKQGVTEGEQWQFFFNKQFPSGIHTKVSQIDGVKVYPNPVTDKIMLDLDLKSSSNVTIQMFTVDGRLIYKHTIPNVQKQTQSILTADLNTRPTDSFVMLKLDIDENTATYPLILKR